MNDEFEPVRKPLMNILTNFSKVEEACLQATLNLKISATEAHILYQIHKSGFPTITDLANDLAVTVSTMTIAVNRMQVKGYVSRARQDNDHRIVRVSLTDTGEAIVKASLNFDDSMIRFLMERLEPEEYAVLGHSLNIVSDFVHQAKADNSPKIFTSSASTTFRR